MRQFCKILILLLSLFFLNSNFLYCKSNSQTPTITVESTAFSKIIIRIPDFKGDLLLSSKLTPLLRKLLNYHLIVLALKNPPLPGFKTKEFYLKGTVTQYKKSIYLKAELWDILKNQQIKFFNFFGDYKHPEAPVYLLCNRIIKEISGYQGIATTKIAFVKRSMNGDTLYVMDFSKLHLKKIKTADLILFPKFSPSGRKIAYIIYKNGKYILEITDLYIGHIQKFFINGLSSSPIWYPDEKALILTLSEGKNVNIYKFDLLTHNLYPLIQGKGICQAGSISPDGRYLAFVYDKGLGPQIYLMNLETKKIFRVSFEGKYNTSPRFSPKGDYLLYLSQSSGTRLILYNIKHNKAKILDLPLSLEDPVFSYTGDYILARGKGKEGTGIYIIHLDSQLYYLYLPGKNFLFPDWSKLW